jgi:hypothetical protein
LAVVVVLLLPLALLGVVVGLEAVVTMDQVLLFMVKAIVDRGQVVLATFLQAEVLVLLAAAQQRDQVKPASSAVLVLLIRQVALPHLVLRQIQQILATLVVVQRQETAALSLFVTQSRKVHHGF